MAGQICFGEAELNALGHHVVVSETYQLVLFTVPKVGCTDLLRLMRRLAGLSDWRLDPHYEVVNPQLRRLGPDRVNDILNDPMWVRAVVLRDPAERLLSAYLDKFVQSASYASNVFRPDGRGMSFAEFLGYVLHPNQDPDLPTGLHSRTDPHWRPQHLVGALSAAEPSLDLVGDFADIGGWARRVLERVGAWEEHGADGWGPDGQHALFEVNDYENRTDAASRMSEFFDDFILRSVYDRYAEDIEFGARHGLDLVKHA